MKRHVIVMLKEPRPGRVKTRLGHDIGMVPAAWWFRHQSARLIRRLRDPRWTLVLAVSPDTAGVKSRVWPADLPRWPQGQGNLGQRMGRMLRCAGPGPVVLIGADIPGVNKSHIKRGFDALGRSELCFGPAPDGGYWLVGAHNGASLPQTLFDNVRWSTQHALDDTIRSASCARVSLIDTLQDVDTVADLNLVAELR